MAEKHSAPLTSYDAFFHGLGHGLPSGSVETIGGKGIGPAGGERLLTDPKADRILDRLRIHGTKRRTRSATAAPANQRVPQS